MTSKKLISLHLLFLLYSGCGILGKLASQQLFFSMRFMALYASSLLVMVVYAILWQRILLTIPLTTAASYKGITVVWGIVWGRVFFNEGINDAKVIATILILTGVAIIGKRNG